MLRSFLVLIAGLSATLLFAEISPTYYREMQEKAPERLKIRVLAFSRDWYFWRNERKAKVEAEVMAVVKSAAGIRTGNRIYIEYTIFYPPSGGWVGPRPMPELEEGKEYDFFGEKTGVHKAKGIELTPTARGYSFDSLL